MNEKKKPEKEKWKCVWDNVFFCVYRRWVLSDLEFADFALSQHILYISLSLSLDFVWILSHVTIPRNSYAHYIL